MQSVYAFVAPPIYEGSDPNGIRTRVTAVKGRCPGPLDDRVTKARAISELPRFYARQIASRFGLRGHIRAFQSGDMSPHSKKSTEPHCFELSSAINAAARAV